MHDGRLDRDQHTERGDHPDQRARPAQRPHDHPVGERPEERRPGDAGDRRQQERPAVLVLQLPLHEDAGDRGRAEREVQHAGAAVDHDQALGCEGVQRADAQAQQRESDDLVHRPPLADPPTLRRETSERSARCGSYPLAIVAVPDGPDSRCSMHRSRWRAVGCDGCRSGPRARVANIRCIVLYVVSRCASVRPRYLQLGEHDVHYE